MSATDELRRMLDERGIPWYEYGDGYTGWCDGACYSAQPNVAGSLIVCGLTPEQAIAATLGRARKHPQPRERWTTVLLTEIAWLDDGWPDYLSVAHDERGEWLVYVPESTLGRGTCYPVPIYGFDGEFTEHECNACSACGTEWDGDIPNFCPWCGRKVVDE